MHLILFIVFAALCLIGAVNLLLQTHPINSALSLMTAVTNSVGMPTPEAMLSMGAPLAAMC